MVELRSPSELGIDFVSRRQGEIHRRRWPSPQFVAGRAALARETAAAAHMARITRREFVAVRVR
jgi:hypothetical protein